MELQNRFHLPLFAAMILQGLQLINGQGLPVPATVSSPVVNATYGEVASLSCGSVGMPLSLCLWERTNSERSNLILTFDTRARSGISSGLRGYNYIGDSLDEGECGFQIDSVKEEDFKKWQCTLIADNKTYRGYVELRKVENVTEVDTNSTVITKGSISPVILPNPLIPKIARQSRQFYQSATSVGLPKGRPIVTVETISDSDFSRSAKAEEAPVGLQIQEVQVQSAGLEIKQKKSRKLVIL